MSAVRSHPLANPTRLVDGNRLAPGTLRARFPIFNRSFHGRRLVYLDTAATAQKPQAVIAAEAAFYSLHNANAHRGLYTLAGEATQLYEQCRNQVADLLDAPSSAAVVLTRSATAALNLAAHGLEHLLTAGDEVLLTEMEHHANLVPWIMLAKRRGVVLRHIPVTDKGELDLARLGRLLSARTRIVSFTHVSNVLGTINPVADIAAAAHGHGAIVILDAAQSVGHLTLDLRALGVDLVAFSAHKCYGPLGLGILAGDPEVMARLEPLEGGGEMIAEVTLNHATWAPLPQRLEAGTPNIAAAAAFPAAIDLLKEVGLDWVRAHERALLTYADDRLRGIPGLRILGPTDPQERGALISFHDPAIHAHDLATLLDQQGIAVRAGHHCAQPLHRRFGLTATTRVSFGIYNSKADVDALIDALTWARDYLNPIH